MIKTDFSYFIYVNFSPIRKKWMKSCKDCPSRLSKEPECQPVQTLIFPSLNNACDDEMFILRYQREQCLCPGNKVFVCLLIYVNISVLHPRACAGLQSPDRYLRSYFSSFYFKGNCLRNKSSFKDFEVEETSKLLKVKTEK